MFTKTFVTPQHIEELYEANSSMTIMLFDAIMLACAFTRAMIVIFRENNDIVILYCFDEQSIGSNYYL